MRECLNRLVGLAVSRWSVWSALRPIEIRSFGRLEANFELETYIFCLGRLETISMYSGFCSNGRFNPNTTIFMLLI